MQYYGTARLGTHQSVAYTGTAGTISNAVGSQTRRILLTCTSNAHVKIAKDQTMPAAATDPFIVGNVPYYLTIAPGEKVSAIQDSSGGTLYVTEVW